MMPWCHRTVWQTSVKLLTLHSPQVLQWKTKNRIFCPSTLGTQSFIEGLCELRNLAVVLLMMVALDEWHIAPLLLMLLPFCMLLLLLWLFAEASRHLCCPCLNALPDTDRFPKPPSAAAGFSNGRTKRIYQPISVFGVTSRSWIDVRY